MSYYSKLLTVAKKLDCCEHPNGVHPNLMDRCAEGYRNAAPHYDGSAAPFKLLHYTGESSCWLEVGDSVAITIVQSPYNGDCMVHFTVLCYDHPSTECSDVFYITCDEQYEIAEKTLIKVLSI